MELDYFDRRAAYMTAAEILNTMQFRVDDGNGVPPLDAFGYLQDEDDQTGIILSFEDDRWIVKD
jgi:hypothetical protein